MLKQILKLAVKDFTIQKRTMISYVIIGLIMSAAFLLLNITDMQMLFTIIIYVIIYGFVNGALYADEKNNTLRLLVSLPVKKEIIVYARYLSVGVVTILTVGLFMGLTGVISGWDESAAGYAVMTMTMFVFIIMLSVYIPMAYKLGYIKAASINKFVFVGMFAFFGAGAAVLGGLLKDSAKPEFLNGLDSFFSSLNAGAVLSLIAIIVLLIFILSLRVSIAFFRKGNLF